MKILALDIWGDYGHFRKFYTTTSPLTFSFPPPPTIAGILGAIYGADKDEYLDVFSLNKCHIAIKIVKPIKKVRMGLNLINTKGNIWTLIGNKYHEPRTQIRTEFLKDPHYRIYVSHEEEKVMDELVQLVREHKSIYSVSLGLSELLCNYKYEGIFKGKEMANGEVELISPITTSNIMRDGLTIESGKKYFKERMPIVMTPDRVVENYDNVIFEPDGKPIRAKVKSCWQLENGEVIAFF